MTDHDVKIDVMIIEDDEVAANSYATFVERIESFHVKFIANTGEQALKLLEHHQPKLLLLDIFLPDVHGVDLLWEIRKKYRGIDVIFITASNETDTVAEAIRGGAFSYIIKPIMMNRFIETLHRYRFTIMTLKQKNLVGQSEVDQFFQSSESSLRANHGREQLPKGIDKLTLQRIKDAIFQVGDNINADECAKLVGVSHSTARRYLEYLVSIHHVEVSIHYGSVGRPERKYRLINKT